MPEPKNSTTARRGRGRPAHQPTAATRAKVSVAAGGGMRHQDIAIALGICADTLAKHYEAELSIGAVARRLEVLQGLHKAARKGSSSAARAYLEHSPQLSPPPAGVGETRHPAAPAPAAGTAAPAPKPVALGKKDQANAEARTAQVGTTWENLLPSPPAVQ